MNMTAWSLSRMEKRTRDGGPELLYALPREQGVLIAVGETVGGLDIRELAPDRLLHGEL